MAHTGESRHRPLGWSIHAIPISGNLDQIPKHVGDHLWTWTAVFRAWPGSGRPLLESGELLRVAGITCHYCGKEYTPVTHARLCRGHIR